MRGVYTVTGEHSNISASENVLIFYNNSAMTDYPVTAELLGASITNSNTETNEQLVGGMFRVTGIGAGGLSGAAYITPEKHEYADASPVCQVSTVSALTHTDQDIELSSVATHLAGFSSLAGYYYDPIPETRIHVRPDQMFAMRISTATFSAFAPVVSITWREIG